jgi:uncharacterized protein YjbJ (UPF0337 family)
MNREQAEGNWMQLKGSVQTKWGRLTDDDVESIAGRREQLIGKIQERYGVARDEAERQVNEWKVAFNFPAEYRSARKAG